MPLICHVHDVSPTDQKFADTKSKGCKSNIDNAGFVKVHLINSVYLTVSQFPWMQMAANIKAKLAQNDLYVTNGNI